MAETLHINSSNKKEKYQSLLPQIKALVEGEKDMIANISNIMSALKYGMDYFWVGIYFVKETQLVLGPFQGTLACTRIDLGKGVCGTAWKEKKTIIVPDVEEFPGHIACSLLSLSEIVVPIFNNKKEVTAVIDVDSDKLNDFDEIDKLYLEEVAGVIEKIFNHIGT